MYVGGGGGGRGEGGKDNCITKMKVMSLKFKATFSLIYRRAKFLERNQIFSVFDKLYEFGSRSKLLIRIRIWLNCFEVFCRIRHFRRNRIFYPLAFVA